MYRRKNIVVVHTKAFFTIEIKVKEITFTLYDYLFYYVSIPSYNGLRTSVSLNLTKSAT